MDDESKKKLWILKFLIRIAYPKYPPYAFLIYLCARYRALITSCRKFEKGIMSRSGITGIFKVEVSPDDESTDVVVPTEFFAKFASENVASCNNGKIWAMITACSDGSIVNRVACERIDVAAVKKTIDAVFDRTSARNPEPHHKLILKSHRAIEKYHTHRVVRLACADHRASSDSVYVSETEHFNLKRKFGIHFADDGFCVRITPILDVESGPSIARNAHVSLINSQHDIGTDLIDTLLKKYFETPKLMHENDVFGVALIPKYVAQYRSKYANVLKTHKKLYFKCTKLNTDVSVSNTKHIIDFACFIVKERTELSMGLCINSMTPKERLYSIAEGKSLTLCPYGLDSNLEEINASIRPFFIEDFVSPIHTMLKVRPSPIFLVSGPNGSGKTILAKVLPFYNGVNSLWFDCHDIMCTTAKQTESKIDNMIQKAKNCSPCFVILRNFHVFGVDFEHNEDSRIVEYFSKKMSELFENFTKSQIIVLALTDGDELKQGLTRIFLEKFSIRAPNKETRLKMLTWLILAKNITICDTAQSPFTTSAKISRSTLDISSIPEIVEVLEKVAAKTNTYLFGDLDLLTSKAMECALIEFSKNGLCPKVGFVRLEDFDEAIECIRSMQSENLDAPKIPKVYWDDIGGLEELKREILRSIELPIKYPHLLRNAGLKRSGVLLYGPPGCGKTLVAKALSTELKISFMSVKGPELLNMYVGQSEENVRKVFSVARSSAPCLVFLDELDALAPARGSAGDAGGVADRVVSQLLAELDGVAGNSSDTGLHGGQELVFIMGATNRPDLIEQSLLRPGRLDKLIYVGPYEGPTQKTKVLTALSRRYILDKTVDLPRISNCLPDRCTGADMMQIVNTARMEAVRRVITPSLSGHDGSNSQNPSADDVILQTDDFQKALDVFVPSITEKDFQYFDQLKMQIS